METRVYKNLNNGMWSARGTLTMVRGFVPLKGRAVELGGNVAPMATLPVSYNPKRGEPGFMINGQYCPNGSVANFHTHMTATL